MIDLSMRSNAGTVVTEKIPSLTGKHPGTSIAFREEPDAAHCGQIQLLHTGSEHLKKKKTPHSPMLGYDSDTKISGMLVKS